MTTERLTWPPMLIHLTESIGALEQILEQGVLRAIRSFGAAYNHRELASTQRVVSLSEVELVDLERLAERHGTFGLGFQRSWVQSQGAAPVWYLPRDSPVQRFLFDEVRKLAFRKDPELDHLLWRLTPFIDYPKDGSAYDWRWEREWRVNGDLRFEPAAVALLIAPEERRETLLKLWLDAGLKASGGRLPPIIDASWPTDRQLETVLRAQQHLSGVYFKNWMPPEHPAPPADVQIDWDANSEQDGGPEDDEHRQWQLEERAEWSGWLDEMARDDIEDY